MTTTRIPRTATRNADQYIAKHESFNGGSLNGRVMSEPVAGWRIDSGRLPSEWARILRDTPEIAYVVTSYATPIAWVLTSGQVIIPNVRHSATTTQHQHAAARALTGDSKTRTDA